ncbi:phospholipase D-like domain-containing protein [Halobacteriovorax sp. HFRX-2_2]
MKSTKKLLTTALLSTLAVQSFAASFNIKDRLDSQKLFLESYQSVYGQRDYAHAPSFFDTIKELDKSKEKAAVKFLKEIDSVLPSKIAMPVTYWTKVSPNEKELGKVIYYFLAYKLFILRDFIDNPLTKDKDKKAAQKLLSKITRKGINSNSISTYFPTLKLQAMKIASSKDVIESIKENEIATIDFTETFSDINNYSLSALGFVPSNKTEIVSENERSLERIDWLNQRVIFAGGTLDFDSDYIKMPTADDPTGNIIFQQDPIYIKIRDMIASSKDSIFIDIFLFGGTLGATLSEYLLDQTKEKLKANPNFKVVLLHDYATNYNMLDEMMPIFEYIKERREKDPVLKKSVSLLQANIQRHPPGIPFGITKLIPKTAEAIKYFESGSTYFESKIDHSKVIVVDGNTENAQAYFGSKNWTDHSGGYYYDDAIYVTGAAAGLVQASYYRDLEAALTEDPKELIGFYYKEQGFDNRAYLSKKDQILEDMRVKKEKYEVKGDSVIRLAEADVDGTIKNVRNILVDMISKAEKNIFMEQLFLYDSYVIDALVKAKRQNPLLDIKLVIDHNGNFGMNGLPNTLFVKKLVDAGIQVRARKTYGITANFPDGSTKEYHQENHRKITSIDGITVLGGSSNINPDTLQGSFREFGAQIFDKKEVASFERRFSRDWHDSDKMEIFDIENFEANIQGVALGKRSSAIINALGSMIYKSKDDIEKRHK